MGTSIVRKYFYDLLKVIFPGVFGTLFMGAICTHCMHMLVQCSNELCIRNQRPALSFSEVVEDAFTSGPVPLRPYAKKMK